jgi:hypothetical protein
VFLVNASLGLYPDLLEDREAALQRWAAAGADLVLGEHIHLPYVVALKGLARPL